MDHQRTASTQSAPLVETTELGQDQRRESSDHRHSESHHRDHRDHGQEQKRSRSQRSSHRESHQSRTPSAHHRPPKRAFTNTWYSSSLPWKQKWSETNWDHGRVLLIDYIRKDVAGAGRIKIFAQEFHSEYELRKFYSNRKLCNQAAFRVVHVQNAPWATKYLLWKFNILPENDLVGMDFGRWLTFEKPEWRAGKPLLKGKTWRAQRDPWRGIVRTAFGVDYLKSFQAEDPYEGQAGNEAPAPREYKMAELNMYDDSDGPQYGYDVYVQRLSVYVQHAQGDQSIPDDLANPYEQSTEASANECYEMAFKSKKHKEPVANGHLTNGKDNKDYKKSRKRKLPPFKELDNTSTVIVFENSQTNDMSDTLVQARGEIESRWRRLAFYLPPTDVSSDERLTLSAMNVVLQDILKALAFNWDNFLNLSETHISILEDKIYDSPADETRAPELWNNSSLWLKVEKLVHIHIDVVRTLALRLNDFTGPSSAAATVLGSTGHTSPDPEDETPVVQWLEGIPPEFEKLADLVQEDLVKPTDNLNDLMYKSVEIRDSRHSLQLDTSMWRLSWITFLFLPLTFMVSFFSMSVDTFENNPSIKWFFIAAVPLMVLVLIMWYVVKHLLSRRHQTPYQRGVYEHLYHDLAEQHPTLWTRAGPRPDVRPQGFFSSLKWRLVSHWMAPERTVRKAPVDPDEDAGGSGLGGWARTKRLLTRRWLDTITIQPGDLEAGTYSDDSGTELTPYTSPVAPQNRVGENVTGAGAIEEVIGIATTVGLADGEPTTHPVTQANLDRLHPPEPQRTRLQYTSSQPQGKIGSPAAEPTRPPSVGSSAGSAGMVEEGSLELEESSEQTNAGAEEDGQGANNGGGDKRRRRRESQANRAWVSGPSGSMRWPWEGRVDVFGG